MSETIFDKHNIDIAWCPGCGNFRILDAIKRALAELSILPQNLVVVSGIGQAPKTPQYFQTNMFNGLHGRALPVATAVKATNRSLTVIAQGGDGDMYGEGGNHFLHTIRRNPDVTHLVHDNMVYGLTKGQAAPTSQRGFITAINPEGVIADPINPVALAISQNASFVARAFGSDVDQLVGILKAAITHKGYALVDIFQPCVTYNKVNTFKWYQDNSYYLDSSYDPTDRMAAIERAFDTKRYALGILYRTDRPVFEDQMTAYATDSRPLWEHSLNQQKLNQALSSYR
jgi:2-oxoglutarate ferredoxin oxidoreductase subunit beta